MLTMAIQNNADSIKKTMARERKNLEFATARALTWTGRDAKEAVEKSLPTRFDRPTAFTKRAVAAIPARRNKMYSRVLIKDTQAKYLNIQEEGGTRTPSGRALVVPVGIRLNRYGNIPRAGVRRALGRADTFSGVVRGVGGIWQRQRNGSVKLLVAYESQATYQPRFNFRATTGRAAERVFPEKFAESFRQAMETAR